MDMWATMKSGPLYGGLFRAPEANDIEPGPPKVHGPGPLHTSFCSVTSNTVLSAVRPVVGTQLALG